ncbi:hypothetical protein [Janthinobacterium fluminis]|uniref:DUF1640 domain-containing protein n=1 Tax=Janthinobacterium fluminis TaxID=2987524 RepID=A0ABT5JUY7_9BURK|nr:hypothetical protein [Janthinobacterium fluminis]MDC8756534.1 hypothetical protein [Janthinobacterium fluminis]
MPNGFNALLYAERLEEGGFSETQAKAAAHALADAIEKLLASKNDLGGVETRLSQKIDDVDLRLTQKIEDAEMRLTQKIDDVDLRLTQKIEDVEMRLTQKIDEVDLRLTQKIEDVDLRLTQKIKDVEICLTQKIEAVEVRLTQKIDAVDARLSAVELSLRHDMAQMEERLMLKILAQIDKCKAEMMLLMFATVVVQSGVIAVLFKFLR